MSILLLFGEHWIRADCPIPARDKYGVLKLKKRKIAP